MKIADLYKSMVAEAYAAFPHLAGRVTYVNLTDEEDVKKANMRGVAAITLSQHLEKKSGCVATTELLERFALVYAGEDSTAILGKDIPAEQQFAYLFDHETAHAAIAGACNTSQHAEMIADAYAALRHLQKFRKDTQLPQYLILKRAAAVVLQPQYKENMEHFTSPVIELILGEKDTLDLSGKTPAELAAKAVEYAERCRMDLHVASDLRKQFTKATHDIGAISSQEVFDRFRSRTWMMKTYLAEKWMKAVIKGFEDGILKPVPKTAIPQTLARPLQS